MPGWHSHQHAAQQTWYLDLFGCMTCRRQGPRQLSPGTTKGCSPVCITSRAVVVANIATSLQICDLGLKPLCRSNRGVHLQ